MKSRSTKQQPPPFLPPLFPLPPLPSHPFSSSSVPLNIPTQPTPQATKMVIRRPCFLFPLFLAGAAIISPSLAFLPPSTPPSPASSSSFSSAATIIPAEIRRLLPLFLPSAALCLGAAPPQPAYAFGEDIAAKVRQKEGEGGKGRMTPRRGHIRPWSSPWENTYVCLHLYMYLLTNVLHLLSPIAPQQVQKSLKEDTTKKYTDDGMDLVETLKKRYMA